MTDVHAAIDGVVDERFEAVRHAFAANLVERDELGAALVVVHRGEVVVDLWGGWADLARTRRWECDTLVNAYSVGKPLVAATLLRLIDEGQVGLDEPVATYWPEFAAAGKHTATVRHALCHRAGVPAIRELLSNDDLWSFDRMCEALAATEPWWVPGERHAYHTNTYGHLIGGIVHRVTGRRPAEALAELAGPVGAEVHVGLPSGMDTRCAEVIWDGPLPPAVDSIQMADLDDDQRMTLLGYVNPPGYSSLGVVNTASWRNAEVPSTNGHMTARGVARFYTALLDGEILSEALLREAHAVQSAGPCPTLGQDVAFGLGFRPSTPTRPLGPTPAGFGHHGTGGSFGFADPSVALSAGYVCNRVQPGWQSSRNRALMAAITNSIDPRQIR